MEISWHVMKWLWVATCFIWLAVQVVAFRRLAGEFKKISWNVFWVVFILMMVSDWIRDVFENPEATRVGMVVVGVAAAVATVVLCRLLLIRIGDRPGKDIEEVGQSLRLG